MTENNAQEYAQNGHWEGHWGSHWEDHWLIASDLDGTLLDHDDYSHSVVDGLLQQLERQRVPVVLNSSKTFVEMLELRRELNNRHPFIAENGSAIFIPREYFPEVSAGVREREDFLTIETGATRAQLLEYLLRDARESGAPYLSFSAASTTEIVDATGLTETQARSAQQRDYSEPLLWHGSDEEKHAFEARARAAGFATLQGGRFLHLLGATDKGSATLRLLDLYRQQHALNYRLIAAGDSPNDLDMLRVADIAVIIRAARRAPPDLQARPGQKLLVSEAVGPAGWKEVIGPLFGRDDF